MKFDEVSRDDIEQAYKQIASYQMETAISAFGNACQLESRQKVDPAMKQVIASALAALAAREFNPKLQVSLDPLLKTISPKLCAQLDEYVELAAKVWPLIRDRCLEIYTRGEGPSISDN